MKKKKKKIKISIRLQPELTVDILVTQMQDKKATSGIPENIKALSLIVILDL